MHRANALAICIGIIGVWTLNITTATGSPIDSTKAWKPNPTGAALRSLILPGGGQAYNQQPLKAVIYGGLEEGLIFGVYRQHQLFKSSRRSGDDVGADFYRNDRNRLTWYLTGVIILSMVDAYVDAHLFDFDVSDKFSEVETRLDKQVGAHYEHLTWRTGFSPIRERTEVRPPSVYYNLSPLIMGVRVKIGWIWR
ncbi:MAG: DUF5683 domain-containing protein [Calditrichota bacterium]